MKRPGLALVVAVLSLLGSERAWAYRPFDFTDADVAGARSLEIELSPAEFVTHGDEHSVRTPSLSINLGIGGGYELSFLVANLVTMEPVPGEPHSQIVDAGIEIKRVLRRGALQETSGPSIAVEGACLFPARGEEHLGGEAIGIVSQTMGAGFATVDVSVTRDPEGRNGAGAGVILEGSGDQGWRPVAELKAEGVRGEPTERAVLLGSIYELREGLAFDFGLNLGISEGEHWTELRSGVTFLLGPRSTAPLRHFARFNLRRRRH